MTDQPIPAEPRPSALADLLTMARSKLAGKVTPELLEEASDQAFTVSMELQVYANRLRELRHMQEDTADAELQLTSELDRVVPFGWTETAPGLANDQHGQPWQFRRGKWWPIRDEQPSVASAGGSRPSAARGALRILKAGILERRQA